MFLKVYFADVLSEINRLMALILQEGETAAAGDDEAKKSNHVVRKIAERVKERKLDQHLEDQFSSGRLLACISSRPGQCGRADGYVSFLFYVFEKCFNLQWLLFICTSACVLHSLIFRIKIILNHCGHRFPEHPIILH